MSISFNKIKNELLVEDGSFTKKNKNKISLVAITILLCTSVVFVSLYITCKVSSNSPNTKKG